MKLGKSDQLGDYEACRQGERHPSEIRLNHAPEIIPAYQGPTEGMKASLKGPAGEMEERCFEASRSWMWSVSE